MVEDSHLAPLSVWASIFPPSPMLTREKTQTPHSGLSSSGSTRGRRTGNRSVPVSQYISMKRIKRAPIPDRPAVLGCRSSPRAQERQSPSRLAQTSYASLAIRQLARARDSCTTTWYSRSKRTCASAILCGVNRLPRQAPGMCLVRGTRQKASVMGPQHEVGFCLCPPIICSGRTSQGARWPGPHARAGE